MELFGMGLGAVALVHLAVLAYLLMVYAKIERTPQVRRTNVLPEV